MNPADQKARLAATSIENSCLVSAPAGSGKTGLLTLRVLKLLAKVEKPEEILCVTFTKKAASEMRERILNALEKSVQVPEASLAALQDLDAHERDLLQAAKKALHRDEAQAWNLVNNPGRLRVTTIDAFCKQICTQLPFFSGLGINPGILDDPGIEYAHVVDTWFEAELLKEQSPSLQVLLRHYNGRLDSVRDLFVNLLAVRDQWINEVVYSKINSASIKQQFEECIELSITRVISRIQELLRPYESELCDGFKFAYEYVGDGKQRENLEILQSHNTFPPARAQSRDWWLAFARYCLTSNGTWRKTLDKNAGFPASGITKEQKELVSQRKRVLLGVFSDLRTLPFENDSLKQLLSLPQTKFSDYQWKVLSALVSLLPELVALLRLRFSEIGQADFVEFSLGCVQALNQEQGDFDLQQRLDYSLKHLLIDEFQDTSQTQLELLRSLTREWTFDDEKTLFLVGDGMQSCYSFRNANVGIFIGLKKSGLANIDLKSLELTVNFRSTSVIVDWVNRVFRASFPTQDDVDFGQVTYTDSESFSKISSESYVKNYLFEKEELNNTRESEYIANEVASLQRIYPDDSIAILAKNRSHLKALVQALTDTNIPFQSLEIDALASKRHIQDLILITRVVVNPSDRVAWLGLLRGPWCALNHEELYLVFCEKEQFLKNNYSSYSDRIGQLLTSDCFEKTTHLRLSSFITKINSAIHSYQRRPLNEIIMKSWILIGGPETLNDRSEFRDIDTFFELLADQETDGQLNSWLSFERALAKLFASPIVDVSNSTVQLMTMHKSKGLEFDTVFLPALDRARRSSDTEALYWLDFTTDMQERKFLLSPSAAKTNKEGDSISEYLRSVKSIRTKLEDTRVFYVACTRARKRLYLTATLEKKPNDEWKNPTKNSLLDKIWITEKDNFLEAPQQINKKMNRSDVNEPPFIFSLKKNWSHPFDSLSYGDRDTGSLNSVDDLFPDESGNTASIKGTVFHRILKTLCEQGFSNSTQKQIRRLTPSWQKQLLQGGVHKDRAVLISQEFENTVSGLTNDQTALWVLDNSHLHSACELSLIDPNQNFKVWIVDRTFVEGDTRWIIDYKTSSPSPDQSLEEFLARERVQYRGQLKQYETLLREFDLHTLDQYSLPNRYRLALFHPMCGSFTEIM